MEMLLFILSLLISIPIIWYAIKKDTEERAKISESLPRPDMSLKPSSYDPTMPDNQGFKIIDINSATEAELSALPGMTPEKAVYAYVMQRNGGFSSLHDFIKRVGFTPVDAMQLPARVCCLAQKSSRGEGRLLDL